MTWAALIEAASPSCGQCNAPVVRVENRWHVDEDGAWRMTATAVCRSRHRVIVEPLS